MATCINQHPSTSEAQLMKKLSNTEAELKKSVAYKKGRSSLKSFFFCLTYQEESFGKFVS